MLQEERAIFQMKIQKKNNRILNIEKEILPYFQSLVPVALTWKMK